MKKISFTLLLLSNLFVFSQTSFNSESYQVTLADIETNTFENDSTANALVIYESGNSYVDPSDYNLRTEVKHKIKILKKEGFNKANITIYLYNDKNTSERVEDIVATTYNKTDNVVVKTKLDTKDIYNDKYDDNHTLVKFTLPNVKEGSIITYSYKLISRFMFNYKGWNFQEDIPKLHSEYKASIPGNWLYNAKLIGYKPLDIHTSEEKKNCLEGGRGSSADCSVNFYVMKDIPAFVAEDYMTTKSNYLARIEYELKTFRGFDGLINDYTKTWKTVDNELDSEVGIGRQLSKSINAEDFLSPDILKETDTLKKADAIYKYVQENYTWNEKYELFKDHTIKDLIKEKSGNVSTLNIFLHNLLKACGIDVKPVLLSTRDNGFPTKIFPVISEFNYIITQATIGGKTYLLDATDNYLSFGEIPFRCLNGYGRLLDFKNGSDWITIEPDKLSTMQYRVQLNLGEDEKINGNVYAKRTGYHALNAKKSYFPNTEQYINKTQDKYPNIEISNHEILSENKTSDEFIETYNVAYENSITGDKIYLNPFLIKFFNENPFKLQERTYPIDFGYKDSYNYALTLNFTENFTLLETPKLTALSLPNDAGKIFFSCSTTGNSLNISLRITFKEAIYQPEYYPYLKELMNKIVDIQNNSLILLRKK